MARKFLTVGEALSRLVKNDPELANQIPEVRRIIAFRNFVVHGYDLVDDALVWNAG